MMETPGERMTIPPPDWKEGRKEMVKQTALVRVFLFDVFFGHAGAACGI